MSSWTFDTHSDKFFSLTGFIAFSTMPELAHKIKMYFALAPIATVKYARSPGTKFLLLPDMMIKVCDSPNVSVCREVFQPSFLQCML